MSQQEDENEFWTDELFFESQDPLMQRLEMRHHDDTGKRVPIAQARVVDQAKKAVVKDIASGKNEESHIIYTLQSDFSVN